MAVSPNIVEYATSTHCFWDSARWDGKRYISGDFWLHLPGDDSGFETVKLPEWRPPEQQVVRWEGLDPKKPPTGDCTARAVTATGATAIEITIKGWSAEYTLFVNGRTITGGRNRLPILGSPPLLPALLHDVEDMWDLAWREVVRDAEIAAEEAEE